MPSSSTATCSCSQRVPPRHRSRPSSGSSCPSGRSSGSSSRRSPCRPCRTTCRSSSRPRRASISGGAASRSSSRCRRQRPRWGTDETVDGALVDDWLARVAHRYPPAAGVPVARAWAGLYDMTPDAHPILGEVADGVYAACGFSGHGFMQAPAVGRIVADELLGDGSSVRSRPVSARSLYRGRGLSRDRHPLTVPRAGFRRSGMP